MREIYGKFSFDGKEYPFACKDYVITIISAGYEFVKDLHEKECDDIISGVTSNNNPIVFFGCKFHCKMFNYPSHILTQGFIILNESVQFTDIEQLFNQIVFYSPAINDFYPPQIAVLKEDKDSEILDFSVKLKAKDQLQRIINLDKCKMILGFYLLNNYKKQNNNLLSSTPCIAFEFDENIGVKELKDYYFKLFNFLSFISFNKNIPFDKITLSKRTNGHLYSVGSAYINSSCKDFESRIYNSIYANDFSNEEIVELFRLVSNNDIKKYYYIPDNLKDIHRFNHSDLLLCATCFEGVFKQMHPDFKSSENNSFKKVKSEFLEFASEYKNNTSLTRNEKKYAEKFYNQIYHYDGLLEEIFNYALKKYKQEISPVFTRCKNIFNYSGNENFGSIYADIRNHFAHGDFFELGNAECFIYEILQVLIYSINLRAANIPSIKVKDMIEKIFL